MIQCTPPGAQVRKNDDTHRLTLNLGHPNKLLEGAPKSLWASKYGRRVQSNGLEQPRRHFLNAYPMKLGHHLEDHE